MALFCWGSTVHGELGLGGIEDEHVITFERIQYRLIFSKHMINFYIRS